MASMLILILLPYLAVGQENTGTKFEKCKLGSSDICFETKIKEVVVKVGTEGTNDDVTLTFCSDFDTTQCCTTSPLKSILSDDWSKGDTETWKGSDLKPCKDQVYKIKKEMLVTISKSGSGRLLVDTIDIYGESPDKKVIEPERFQCGGFDIGGSKITKESKKCQTGPYHYQSIERALFQIGEDGTDDDVTFKIASDANSVTCSQKLSHTFANDWVKDKLETWLKSDFGKCKDTYYKITTAPVFSISKNGKDDLVVRASTFYLRTLDNDQVTKYDCGPFELKGDCKDASFCTKTFNNCKATVVTGAEALGPTTTTTTTTKKPTTATTTTGKPGETTTKGGLLSKIFGRR